MIPFLLISTLISFLILISAWVDYCRIKKLRHDIDVLSEELEQLKDGFMTNETGMDIFKAFSDLSRMDKEDFARYVVNNLANRSRERLLFYLAADFLEFIQGNNDFTTKQIKKLVSLGINLGKEWTLQNLLDCLPLRVGRAPQTKWVRVDNPNEEYEECLDSDGGYPNISGHLTISVMYGRWVFDFDNKGINGRKPQDTSFTEAAIKMAEFCVENDLM